jgi:hypothetical protein
MRSALLTFLVTILACDARRAEDDLFARSFLDQLKREDTLAIRSFDPRSSITSEPWAKIMAAKRRTMDSTSRFELLEWETSAERNGPFHKLLYGVDGNTKALVHVWLVQRDSTRKVNTLRFVGAKQSSR